MDIFETIIEAGIGFAGFAGVVIALSGDSKYWLYEEKLRMGLMLILFLTPLFTSFICLVLLLELPPHTVGFWMSVITGLFFIVSCLIFFLLAKSVYSHPGTTYSVRVAVFAQSTLILMAFTTLINAFLKFAPPLAILSGLLVCSLFIGAIIFLRILFLRPRSESEN